MSKEFLDEKDIRDFYLHMDESTCEKDVEMNFYSYLMKYFQQRNRSLDVKYTSQYYIDGIINLRTYNEARRILIEAKYDKNFTNQATFAQVLSQAIYYLNILFKKKELLPTVTILVSKNEIAVIDTLQLMQFTPDIKVGLYNASSYYMDIRLNEKIIKSPIDYKVFSFVDIDSVDLGEIFDFIYQLNEKSILKQIMKNNYDDSELNTLIYLNKKVIQSIDIEHISDQIINIFQFKLNDLTYDSNKKKFFHKNSYSWRVYDEKHIYNKIDEIIRTNQEVNLNYYNNYKDSIVEKVMKLVKESFSGEAITPEEDYHNSEIADLKEWFENSLEIVQDNEGIYFISALDLYADYKSYAFNNKKVSAGSLRAFADLLKETKIFDNTLIKYKKSAYIKGDYRRSLSDRIEKSTLGNRPTIYLNLRFSSAKNS